MAIDAQKTARVFRALCDVKRIAIIQLLQTGEKCACKITDELGIAQSALSYHMRILCESGIVESWYVGKWTHYRISRDGSKEAMAILKELTCVSENEVDDKDCDD